MKTDDGLDTIVDAVLDRLRKWAQTYPPDPDAGVPYADALRLELASEVSDEPTIDDAG